MNAKKTNKVLCVIGGIVSAFDLIRSVGGIEVFDQRMRFNWGYHEGAEEAKRRLTKQTDFSGQGPSGVVEFFTAGYMHGWEDQCNGVYKNSSAGAWDAYQVECRELQSKEK